MKSCEMKFVGIFQEGKNLNLEKLSNAKLQTDDGCTFNIHRDILARSSDYFRTMFCGMDTERSEFRIPGISGECLSEILCYVYTGEIVITQNSVSDLIIAADYLLLKDLYMRIKGIIKAYLAEVNCLRILQAAHQSGDADIFRQCFRFTQTRFEGVMRCQKNDLADLPLDILISILSNRSLYVYNESTVWQAIVEWTKKDIPLRMSYIPQLLLTLAMEDVGEELATEILQHGIISQNRLFRRIQSRPDLEADQIIKRKKTSNLDVLSSFLSSYWTRLMEPNRHRIPLKLHVLSFCAGAGDRHNLYITYDENPDIVRKITEVSYKPDALIAVRHDIYTLKWGQLRKFNLITMNWVRVCSWFEIPFSGFCLVSSTKIRQFRDKYYDFFVVALDCHIYVFLKTILDIREETYGIKVYDTENNSWFNGGFLHDISYGTAVTIEEKIYVVGKSSRLRRKMMQMFDPATQQWSRLSPPTFYHSTFRLVVYHQKIYMMGSYSEQHSGLERLDIEVFDPAKNLWEKLPELPYTYSLPGAVVFNDQLIFFDHANKPSTKNVRWNDAKQCWENLEETYNFKNLHLLQSSCIVDDVDAISAITKQNRDPGTKMEESLFI